MFSSEQWASIMANPVATARRPIRANPITVPRGVVVSRLGPLSWVACQDRLAAGAAVPILYNPSGGPDAAWFDGVADVWDQAGGTNFNFANAEPLSTCPSLIAECGDQRFNQANEVGWVALSSKSTLGITVFSTSDPDEADIALNTGFMWTLDAAVAAENGGRIEGCRGPSFRCKIFDTFTVMLHELGHEVGLGHSSVNGAVMEPSYDGPRRALHAAALYGPEVVDPGDQALGATTIESPFGGQIFFDRETVQIDVLVTDDTGSPGTPIQGVAVHVQVVTPKRTLVGDATTGTDGVAHFTYKVEAGRDGRGAYILDATATLGGDQVTDQVIFRVE